MTIVKIGRVSGKIATMECDGHTNYAVEGEDIICSALSSIAQTAVLGLMTVVGINVNLVRDDNRGYLKITLPKLTNQQRHDADMILETMLLGIADLAEGYSDFIELEVK